MLPVVHHFRLSHDLGRHVQQLYRFGIDVVRYGTVQCVNVLLLPTVAKELDWVYTAAELVSHIMYEYE